MQPVHRRRVILRLCSSAPKSLTDHVLELARACRLVDYKAWYRRMIFLSTVEDTFQIANVGCVVAVLPVLHIKRRTHDSIQLRTPDGRVVDTYVAAIPMVC